MTLTMKKNSQLAIPQSHETFGRIVEQNLIQQPFGSLGKRELELILLKGLLEAGLCKRDPVALATKLGLTLTKAHSYLTELALREPLLSDRDAILQFKDGLMRSEVKITPDEILIPLPEANLRIWLERKLAAARLIKGETLRQDLIRISPRALLNVLEICDGYVVPKDAIKVIEKKMPNADWLPEAVTHWKGKSKWSDVSLTAANVASVVQTAMALYAFVA